MPTVRLVNPSRKRRRRASGGRKRRQPAGLRRYWAGLRASSRKNAGGGHMKKRRLYRRRRAHRSSRRRSSLSLMANPSRRRRRNRHRSHSRRSNRRAYRNPSFGGMSTTDLLWMGGAALADGVLCRAIPQMLAPSYNVGWTGYALNAAVGGVGAWLLGKFNRRAGQGAWIGMIVAVGQRIISEQFGAGSAGASGGMSGDLDFDLGYYLSDPFPFAQGASAGPYQTFPGTPYAPVLPTANAAAGARSKQTAALVAATTAPVAPATTGPASTGQSAGPAVWGAHGGAWGG